jgi:hypothetical protein
MFEENSVNVTDSDADAYAYAYLVEQVQAVQPDQADQAVQAVQGVQGVQAVQAVEVVVNTNVAVSSVCPNVTTPRDIFNRLYQPGLDPKEKREMEDMLLGDLFSRFTPQELLEAEREFYEKCRRNQKLERERERNQKSRNNNCCVM